MTDVVLVPAGWLALRETADARSRCRRLAGEAVRLQPPIVVHDLGSGGGAMMRWLAPRLPGPQTWILHDPDPQLLDAAAAATVRDAAGGLLEIRTRIAQLAELDDGDLAGASLVTASALLDVLTPAQAEAIVAACVSAGVPLLAVLTVTGRVRMSPVDPGDRVFEAACNDHRRRPVDGGRLLGSDAVAFISDRFRAAGWSVRVSPSPWRLRGSDAQLAGEWLDGWVDAAVEQRPALQEWGAEYRRTRRRQLANGELRVTVHHRDLLAWPP